jgi:hypothetical protein
MPAPLLIPIAAGATAGITGFIIRALTIFFLVKGVFVVARMMVMLGLAFGIYKWVIEPLVAQAMSTWTGLPGDFKTWLSAFGIIEVVSIMLSAYGLWAAKKLFLQRRG